MIYTEPVIYAEQSSKEKFMYHESAKDVLRKTMFRLMNHKSIEKIRLTDILKQSKVSKSTFYRHFRDKYALMNDCYAYEIGRRLEELEHDNWNLIVREFLQFFYENRTFLLNGFRGKGSDSLKKFIFDYTVRFYEDQMKLRKNCKTLTPEEKMAIYFNVGGSVTMLEAWLEHPEQYGLSVSEAADLHYRFIPEIIKTLFPPKEEGGGTSNSGA